MTMMKTHRNHIIIPILFPLCTLLLVTLHSRSGTGLDLMSHLKMTEKPQRKILWAHSLRISQTLGDRHLRFPLNIVIEHPWECQVEFLYSIPRLLPRTYRKYRWPNHFPAIRLLPPFPFLLQIDPPQGPPVYPLHFLPLCPTHSTLHTLFSHTHSDPRIQEALA